MEVNNHSEAFGPLEVDPSFPSYRISRKQKLASHMSKVCKEKLDAVQAKMSKISKISKRGRPPKAQGQVINSCKLSQIRKKLLKHNPGKWSKSNTKVVEPSKSCNKNESAIGEIRQIKEEIDTDTCDYLIEDPLALPDSQQYTEKNVSKMKRLRRTKEEIDTGTCDDPIEDPLALPDTLQSSEKNVSAIEEVSEIKEEIDTVTCDNPIEDPLALPDTQYSVVKKEPDDLPTDEVFSDVFKVTNDGDQLKFKLKSEPGDLENIVWLEDNQEDKDSQIEEKDPLASDEIDKDYISFTDYSNSFIWDRSNWKNGLNEEKYCIYCGYNTRSRLRLKRHISSRHIKSTQIKNNVFKNYDLPFSVFKENTEDRHEHCFYCFHCSFFTNEPTVLKNHLIIYHKSKAPSFCSICDYETFFPHELNLHLMSAHSKEEYLPKLKKLRLNIKTKVPASPNVKLESEVDKRPQKLPYNNTQLIKPSSNAKKLKKRIMNEIIKVRDFASNSITSGKDQAIAKNKVKNSVVFCPHCDFSSNEPYQILIHLTNEHKKKLFCSKCSFVTSNPLDMQCHINTEHTQVYECSKCGYLITELKDFEDHIEKKHYLKCSICSFSTYLLQHLEKHLIAAHTQKMYSLIYCSVCKYKSYNPYEMIEHLKTKHGTALYHAQTISCTNSHCGAVLQSHLEALYESGHECSYCFFRSSDQNEYIIHLAKKHVRRLPIKCDYCNFFTDGINKLAEHIKTEREKRKTFFCLFCHFSSAELNELNIHLQKMHRKDVHPFKCSLCKAGIREKKNATQMSFICEAKLQKNDELEHKKSQSGSEEESSTINIQKDSSEHNNQLFTELEDNGSVSNDKTDASEKQISEPIVILDDGSSEENLSSKKHLDSCTRKNSESSIECYFICPICYFLAANEEELRTHASTQHMGKKLHCQPLKGIKEKLPENCPVREDKEDTTFKCFNCLYITPHKELLKEHLIAEHSCLKFFCCSHCSFLSASLDDLASHIMNIHENGEEFLCLHCPYSTTNLQNLEEHLEIIHKTQSTFSCINCHFETTKLQELYNHMQCKHEEYSAPSQIVKEIYLFRQVFTCFHCNYSNYDPQTLSHHVKTDHFKKRPNIFFCYFCNFFCPHFNELEDHINSKHETQKHFACPYCNFSTWNRDTFLKHLPSAHGIEFLFDCSSCSYRTSNSELLRMHINMYHSSPENFVKIIYSCPLCDSYITNEKQLNEHVVLEHATMTFFCSYCSYCTGNLSKLECHATQAHKKGINVCSCPNCDFITSQYSTLQKHLIKHGKEHKSENETRVSILQVNLAEKESKSIPLEIIFACSDCDFSTDTSEKLQEHILMEHCNNQQIGQPKELNVYAPEKLQPRSKSEVIKLSEVFETKDKETTHGKEDNIPITFCPFCDFGTDDPNELRQHKEDEHQVLEKSLYKDSTTYSSSQGTNKSSNKQSRYLVKSEDSLGPEENAECLPDSPVFSSKYSKLLKPSNDLRTLLAGKSCNAMHKNAYNLHKESIVLEKERLSVTKQRNIILTRTIANKEEIASTSHSKITDSLLSKTIKHTNERKDSISMGINEHNKTAVKIRKPLKKIVIPSNAFFKLKFPEKAVPNQVTQNTNLVSFSCYQCNFKTSNPFELQKHTLTNHKKLE